MIFFLPTRKVRFPFAESRYMAVIPDQSVVNPQPITSGGPPPAATRGDLTRGPGRGVAVPQWRPAAHLKHCSMLRRFVPIRKPQI